jgi:hypothetical protein
MVQSRNNRRSDLACVQLDRVDEDGVGESRIRMCSEQVTDTVVSFPIVAFFRILPGSSDHTLRLASRAFLSVLSRKQSKFQPVLAWLNNQAAASKPRTREDAMQLLKAIRIGAQAYQDFKY